MDWTIHKYDPWMRGDCLKCGGNGTGSPYQEYPDGEINFSHCPFCDGSGSSVPRTLLRRTILDLDPLIVNISRDLIIEEVYDR